MSKPPFVIAAMPKDHKMGAFFNANGYGSFRADAFAKTYEAPRFEVYGIADQGAQILAACLIQMLGDEAEIIEIAVAAPERGKQRGHQLLAWLITKMRAKQNRRLLLEVACDNRPALGMYEKHNFVRIGERAGYYRRKEGTRIDAVVMELWLSKS